MKKIFLIVFIGILLGVTAIQAQVIVSERTDMKYDRPVFGAGVTVGPYGGAGVSFRHHLPVAFSYTISGGIIKIDQKLHYDAAMDFQYDLARGPNSRYFVVLGFGYYYSGNPTKNNLEGPFRTGIGMGGEVSANGPLHVSLQGAFTFFSDGTILPLPQLGIHYYFY